MSNYPDDFSGEHYDDLFSENEREYPTTEEVSIAALTFTSKAATDFETWLKAHSPKDAHEALVQPKLRACSAHRYLTEILLESMLDCISTPYRREVEK